ncbi:hypothetical protein [Streptomyces sp. 7N604]|uniref:hypothetical protein n=1 Tax=Streptomyces sp. 7N604 TaxID=3457415 RepID=UPI003FD0A649
MGRRELRYLEKKHAELLHSQAADARPNSRLCRQLGRQQAIGARLFQQPGEDLRLQRPEVYA